MLTESPVSWVLRCYRSARPAPASSSADESLVQDRVAALIGLAGAGPSPSERDPGEASGGTDNEATPGGWPGGCLIARLSGFLPLSFLLVRGSRSSYSACFLLLVHAFPIV